MAKIDEKDVNLFRVDSEQKSLLDDISNNVEEPKKFKKSKIEFDSKQKKHTHIIQTNQI